MVSTIVNNNTARISIRKALTYSGCSKNIYYGNKDHRYRYYCSNCSNTIIIINNNNRKRDTTISMQRPTYGTRRMAAMLTRILGIPVNRKRVQRIFRKMGYITPSKSKKEILRSNISNVKADRPNQVWKADLIYIHCGIDGWSYLFNVFDIFTREWVGYCFDLSAVKENAIIAI